MVATTLIVALQTYLETSTLGDLIMVVTISEECSELTLEQIKWLVSVTKKGNVHNLSDCCCRKQRKRLKSNSGKCDKTIDMFSNENVMFEEKEDE